MPDYGLSDPDYFGGAGRFLLAVGYWGVNPTAPQVKVAGRFPLRPSTP